MLIIEGTDMLGKTTLCQELVKRINAKIGGSYTYEHFSKLPECWDYWWDYLPHVRRRVVMDRFHMSEVAYRRARGEPEQLDSETYRLLDAKLRLVGAYTVVVIATERWLRTKIGSRPEMHTGEQILAANAEFTELATIGGVDADFVIEVDDDSQYPTNQSSDVDVIVNEYLNRQAHLNGLLRQRNETHGTLL